MILALAAVAAIVAPQQGCGNTCVERVQARVAAKHAMQERVRTRLVTLSRRARVRPYRAWLDKVRPCESVQYGYSANTGNGFYGGYQFTLQSWSSVGGSGLPSEASPLEQDFRAVLLLERQGRGAWPVCG